MTELDGATVVDSPGASPTLQFAIDELQKDPTISFADVRDRAAMHGLTVFPIVYGRAKALLGLVKVAPRGTGKRAQANAIRKAAEDAQDRVVAQPVEEPQAEPEPEGDQASKPLAKRKRVKRPRAQGGVSGRIEDLLADVVRIGEEWDRYRAALEQIVAVLDEALG